MAKRHLNWVRFLAMRYRRREPKQPGMLLRWLTQRGWVAQPAPPPVEKAFDEDILVALSAVYQGRREWIVDPAQFERLKPGAAQAPNQAAEEDQRWAEAIQRLTPKGCDSK
jgi:hypothetical protein